MSGSGKGGSTPFPSHHPTSGGSEAREPLDPAPSPHIPSSSPSLVWHLNHHAHQGHQSRRQPLPCGLSF